MKWSLKAVQDSNPRPMLSFSVAVFDFLGPRFTHLWTWELDCWSLKPLSSKMSRYLSHCPHPFPSPFPCPLPHPHSSVNFAGFIITGLGGCFPHWAVTLHVSAHGLVLWLFCCCWTWLTCCCCREGRSLTLLFCCLILAWSHVHTEWHSRLMGFENGFQGQARQSRLEKL